MLYSEFIEGTGCRDNDHNFEIYRRLELMYMADTIITKQEIYEYGKKLVDNSKSADELALEAELNKQIAWYKEEIKKDKKWIEYYIEIEDKRMVKYYKDEIRTFRRHIRENRWILGQSEL